MKSQGFLLEFEAMPRPPGALHSLMGAGLELGTLRNFEHSKLGLNADGLLVFGGVAIG
jgi:hypothetical protein